MEGGGIDTTPPSPLPLPSTHPLRELVESITWKRGLIFVLVAIMK